MYISTARQQQGKTLLPFSPSARPFRGAEEGAAAQPPLLPYTHNRQEEAAKSVDIFSIEMRGPHSHLFLSFSHNHTHTLRMSGYGYGSSVLLLWPDPLPSAWVVSDTDIRLCRYFVIRVVGGRH